MPIPVTVKMSGAVKMVLSILFDTRMKKKIRTDEECDEDHDPLS
jgi:hypothetical protein